MKVFFTTEGVWEYVYSKSIIITNTNLVQCYRNISDEYTHAAHVSILHAHALQHV